MPRTRARPVVLTRGSTPRDQDTRGSRGPATPGRRELLSCRILDGSHGSGRVQQIYANASTTIRQARNLQTLVNAIDSLDWYSAKSEGLGDLYEGLLEKNAEETKSGAGQCFTPRALIESMVHLVKPQPGELASRSGRGRGGVSAP